MESKKSNENVEAEANFTPEDLEKKLKNQEKNEAKRKAKMEKLIAKQDKIKEMDKGKDASKIEGNGKDSTRVPSKNMEKEKFVNKTPKGEKKNLSEPMATSYDPAAVESAWYDWWENQGFFKPANVDNNPMGKFVMAIPPPNVTGSLHLGHALTNAIEDSLVRWHRMRGEAVLWNPGCDHAGIATQAVVEKRLWKEKKLTRHDLGRETFIAEVWKWKEQYGNRIYAQLKRLGSSLDWDRACFTMDEKLAKAVTEAFVRLHEEGIIYRSTKLVNWCSQLKTAISNLEVDYKDLKGKTMLSVPGHDENKKYEFGVLTLFAYRIENSNDEIIVATTRPETMLGDTAVAVHPDDIRYKHLHGKFAIHPFVNRKLPIITDSFVKMEFGTGAVKITPAHDPIDYDCGKRKNLPFINVLTEDGCINENGGGFQGMKRFDARNAVLSALKKEGLYRETKDHEMSVPICSRSGDVIEPMLKPQWFVQCDEMAKSAIEAVRKGDLEIIPKVFEKIWFSWLENIQDWCISRQLWWGHRVPAYYVEIDGQSREVNEDQCWLVGRTEAEAMEKARKKFSNVPAEKLKLHQDPDVLDTWFSSGLFPFSIFGWPEDTNDFQKFYPTTLLETGHDILFFWVARMVMLGQKLTGQLPFKQIYLHALVGDAHGRKMSKSLGNVIDPIDVIEGITLKDLHKRLEEGSLSAKEIEKAKTGQIEDYPSGIPECGTDALRFALCSYTSQARDINLDIKRVAGYRAFCNKIWNATRFVLNKLGENYLPNDKFELSSAHGTTDRWIISRLNDCIKKCNEGFTLFEISTSTNAIYQFWIYEFCDFYLEAIKPAMLDETNDQALRKRKAIQDVLYECLDHTFCLLSPFMPYLTEELYQRLPRRPNDRCPSICLSHYPQQYSSWTDAPLELELNFIQNVIHASRSLVSDYLKPSQKPTFYIQCRNDAIELLIRRERQTISTLSKAGELNIFLGDDLPTGCILYNVNEDCNIYLLVKGLVNIEEEITKLEKEKSKIENQLRSLFSQSQMEDYQKKVPETVREANKSKANSLQTEMEFIEKALNDFLRLQ